MFEEHAFPGAALSDDCRNLVFIDAEVDLVEYGLFTEPLRHVPEFYQGVVSISILHKE